MDTNSDNNNNINIDKNNQYEQSDTNVNLTTLETINTLDDPNDSTSNNNNNLLTANKNDIVDIYLKKHKLDLKVLPNKKMIKLSDLSNNHNGLSNNNYNINATTTKIIQSSTDNTIVNEELTKNENKDLENKLDENDDDDADGDGDGDDEEEEYEEEDYDEFESDSDYENEYEEEQETKIDELSTTFQDEMSNSNEKTNDEKSSSFKTRKKREPSLKLKQKLSNDDLELIVGCVRDKQAEVHIADIKKDNHVDKILNVKLLNTKLSNGTTQALLKKSMFPKDLNTLFDTFINSLCGQDFLTDSNGVNKPALKCLVVDCGFKSLSEAEMMRHLKRHLAQDGYTCSVCSHQFASMTNLQRHSRIHTGNPGKEVKCQHCDYKASTLTHVKRHMAHKHLERSLPCPHCSFMGATNAELKIHLARKHLELTGKNPLFLPKYLRKDYQCSICKEQYTDFKEYQTHMYEHTSSLNRFQCSECPYNCKNYSKLKRHMLYHMGARNFECKICGNKFFQMEHLKRHMLSIHNVTNIDSSMISVPSNFQQNNTINNTNINSNNSRIGKKNTISPLKHQNHLIKKQDEPSTTQVKIQTNVETLLDSQRTRTIDNKEIKNDLNIIQNQPADVQQQPEQHNTLKIDLNCIYKCQKCKFSTDKLFVLNEHAINQHFKENDAIFNAQDEPNINDNILNEIEMDDEDADEQIYADKNEENLVKEVRLRKFGSTYPCAFCSFKTNERAHLKRHLLQNHSTQATAPILLANEAIVTHPNTRYQCGACKQSLNNIAEFVKHMDEKHKIQVYLIDSNNNNNTNNSNDINNNMNQNTQIALNINNESQAQPIQINSNFGTVAQRKPPKQQKPRLNTKKSQSNKQINGEHQQIRSFINSTSHISRQYNMNQNSTVRINPLLLKHHNIVFNKPNQQQEQQQQQQQQQHQLEQQHQQQQIHQLAQQLANETNSSSNIIIVNQDNSNNSNIINQIVDSIDLIQEELQESDDKLLQLIS